MNNRLIAQTEIGRISGIGKFVPSEAGGTADSFTQVELIFSTILGFLTIVAGLTFLVYFAIGALNWVSAGGDSKKVDDAKHHLTNGAIGMIVIIATYSIISIVGSVLGLNILEPGETLKIFIQAPGSTETPSGSPSSSLGR